MMRHGRTPAPVIEEESPLLLNSASQENIFQGEHNKV